MRPARRNGGRVKVPLLDAACVCSVYLCSLWALPPFTLPGLVGFMSFRLTFFAGFFVAKGCLLE